jgi:catechol 2,3-dioxygenase-like lactoylglutathione lyase family enzyme
MRFRLDHVVIAVADLDAAVRDYRDLGFNVQIGGRHSDRPSHNALIVFEDGAYIELISWLAPNPGDRWWEIREKHGEGLIDFALLPEDTGRAVAEAKGRGLSLKGPIDGGRLRPDGQKLQWQTARQETFDLPFLCGDVTARSLRVPAGAARRHPNGVVGVSSVAVLVTDPAASLARYLALLGIGQAPADGVRVGCPVVVPGTARVASICLDESALVLVAPLEDAPLRERLGKRGEGAYALALRSGDEAQPRLLDPSRTHGVAIQIGA